LGLLTEDDLLDGLSGKGKLKHKVVNLSLSDVQIAGNRLSALHISGVQVP
jgi:hypothetical protein